MFNFAETTPVWCSMDKIKLLQGEKNLRDSSIISKNPNDADIRAAPCKLYRRRKKILSVQPSLWQDDTYWGSIRIDDEDPPSDHQFTDGQLLDLARSYPYGY